MTNLILFILCVCVNRDGYDQFGGKNKLFRKTSRRVSKEWCDGIPRPAFYGITKTIEFRCRLLRTESTTAPAAPIVLRQKFVLLCVLKCNVLEENKTKHVFSLYQNLLGLISCILLQLLPQINEREDLAMKIVLLNASKVEPQESEY